MKIKRERMYQPLFGKARPIPLYRSMKDVVRDLRNHGPFAEAVIRHEAAVNARMTAADVARELPGVRIRLGDTSA